MLEFFKCQIDVEARPAYVQAHYAPASSRSKFQLIIKEIMPRKHSSAPNLKSRDSSAMETENCGNTRSHG